METFIVVSKLKKYAKESHDLSVGSNFLPVLNAHILESIDHAIAHAQKSERKTVMGRDFNLYVHEPKIENVLVVASKLKAYIKEKSGLSCSKQCFEQLTVRIHKILEASSQKTLSDKRKTLLDRDFMEPTAL